MSSMYKITIRFPDDIKEPLRACAAEHGLSINNLVLYAVRDFLRKGEYKISADDKKLDDILFGVSQLLGILEDRAIIKEKASGDLLTVKEFLEIAGKTARGREEEE